MAHSMTPAAATATTTAGPAVIFDNVYLGFDEGDILRGVSFSVPARETMVLLGETGTGKTLPLKLAAGLLKPTRGSISVLGEQVSSMSENELLRLRERIGFVFQEGALFDSMTVGENVAYRLREEHVKEDEIEPRAQEALKFVNSNPPPTHPPPNYPGACVAACPSRGRSSIARTLSCTIHLPQVSIP